MLHLTRTRPWQKSTLDHLIRGLYPLSATECLGQHLRARVAVDVGLRQRVDQAVTVLFLEARLATRTWSRVRP